MESSSHSHQRPSYHHDFYGSEYIGSIRALSAYYDDNDDDHQQKRQQYPDDSHGRSVPSSPLPFAIDDDDIRPLCPDGQCESLSSNALLDGSSLLFRERDISSSPPHDDDVDEEEEGGIVILSSPDDDGDDNEDMWESHGLPLETEQTTSHTRQLEQQPQPRPETMAEPPLDSIIMAAAAHVERQQNTTTNTSTLRRQDGSLLDLEAWMEQAEGALAVEEDSSNRCNHAAAAAATPTTNSIWDRFHNKTNHAATTSSPSSSSSSSLHPSPIRATQLRHNQFIVQLDIVPPPDDCRTTQEWQRYVMDVMSNVQWLHLWFDPIPIVLETTVLDGSGSYSPPNSSSLVTTSPYLSGSGPLPDRGGEYGQQPQQQRRRDGEWIEISTPPLKPPHDSHLSTCFRRVRVGIRSTLGFPQRIRSMLLIERNVGRMGMTIGYGRGMVVHHEWSVRREGERIVVLDEVRLHRSDEEDGGGGGGSGRRYYFYCCFCVVMRFVWRLVEWVLVRWYQPDLASYMAQTITSLEKLRILIEGGVVQEAVMMEGENWDGGNHADLISAPLLG